MIGVHVLGGPSPVPGGHGVDSMLARFRKKTRDEGLWSALRAAGRHIAGRGGEDLHVWHPTYPQLLELVKLAGFDLEKECWLKPPLDTVIYLMARKPRRAGPLAAQA